jgi:hypothetical protein
MVERPHRWVPFGDGMPFSVSLMQIRPRSAAENPLSTDFADPNLADLRHILPTRIDANGLFGRTPRVGSSSTIQLKTIRTILTSSSLMTRLPVLLS